jgi:hypothetical protein
VSTGVGCTGVGCTGVPFYLASVVYNGCRVGVPCFCCIQRVLPTSKHYRVSTCRATALINLKAFKLFCPSVLDQRS